MKLKIGFAISGSRLLVSTFLLAASLIAHLDAAPEADARATSLTSQGNFTLQNSLLSFEFSRDDGSLAQITDRTTGYSWLNPTAPHRLIKLIQRTPEKTSNILLSNEAPTPELSFGGDTLTIRFPALRDRGVATGIKVTVRVRLPEGSPEAYFSVELDNSGAYPIEEIWFPFVACRSGAANSGEDVFTTSHGIERKLYESFDHGTFDTHAFGQHLQRIGHSSSQLLPMMDLSNPHCGLSYIKYERRTRPTDFVYENILGDPKRVELGWAWVTTVLLPPGQVYHSCEFGLGVHQSDWHATADRLRRFMDPWWHASNMPTSLKEKIGFYHVQIKGFNGEPFHDFDELPGMARDCQKYGITDMLLWDCTAIVYCRPDVAGDFWEMPRDREQKFRRALKEVKDMGFHISACVNYRLINETSRAWQRIGSEAQYSIFGVPLYGNSMCSINGAIYLNRNYEMGTRSLCQGTERFAAFARDLTKQTLDLGLNSLFIDEAWESCYALPKNRDGLDPFAVMERSYAWFGEATQTVRKADSEAYSMGEVPDIWNTQLIDAWWVWGWDTPGWPPPEVFMYVMPETCYIWCIDEHQRPLLSKAFAMGAFLAIGTHGLTGLVSDEPDLGAQIARLAKLRKTTAEFVSHGRFVDKRGLSLTGAEGFVFQSTGGFAVTLANGKPDAVEVKVHLRPSMLTDKQLAYGQVHFESGNMILATPSNQGKDWELSVRLDPYAAAIWTIPFAK